MATLSSDQLKYQWSIVNYEGEEIIEDGECFKNSDSHTLVIDCFESRYAGTYRCVISTSSRPVVSMSAEVELDLPGKYQNSIINQNSRYFLEFSAEFPEDFSTEMSKKDFLLFINANGIQYKICKKFKGIRREKNNHYTYGSCGILHRVV